MFSSGDDLPRTPLLFVIFGGTGDLSHRKLLPALYDLMAEGRLPEEFGVLAVGRRDKDDAAYREEARASIAASSRSSADGPRLERFLSRVHYHRMHFDSDPQGYERLRESLRGAEQGFRPGCVRLFFLAVAPEYFGLIVTGLTEHGLAERGNPQHRVMVEKPFGSDLGTARELNRTISGALDENQVYRIDHYLGKEMIQNILAIRFGNSLFEPLWNHHHVDNIQITSAETLGVEGRGSYYEQAGILRDMLQNHLLQMLALITMEPPVDLSPESVRDEKVKVLRSLRRFSADAPGQAVVSGQYGPGRADGREVPGYREEEKVRPRSEVPTFIALRACVDNFRWGSVPVYIRAGKRLDRRRTQIVVEFRRLPGVSAYREFGDLPPNLLVIEVQPSEGMYFQINAKRPGNEFRMERVELNYSQHSRFQGNVPEAYERLILEAFRGNSSLFTRWDELENSWSFVDSVGLALATRRDPFPNYPAGSRGPQAADRLVGADGRRWWEIDLP